MRPLRTLTNPNDPYALRRESEQERRRELLDTPQIRDLTDYVRGLRATVGLDKQIPDFDPLDGGVMARALFLLEAPGPKAVLSGFVSRNNPDPTAKNICELFGEAGFVRQDSVIWNVVPWYVGTGNKIRPIRKAELIESLPHVIQLLTLLPRLEIIVLLGLKPQKILNDLGLVTNCKLFSCFHPSNQTLNRYKDRRREILDVLRDAASSLGTPNVAA